jgi:hypothetical protein
MQEQYNWTQQQCILSGEVYLRHRLKGNCLPFLSDTLYHKNEWRARLAYGRAGVQETVRFCTKDVRFVPRKKETYRVILAIYSHRLPF